MTSQDRTQRRRLDRLSLLATRYPHLTALICGWSRPQRPHTMPVMRYLW